MSTPPPDESDRPAGWPDYPARPDYPGYPAGSTSGGPAYPPTYPAAPGPGRPAYPGQPAYPGYPVYLPTPSGTGATPAPVPEVCTWHPDRQTALHCTRCGRPACPECLTPASVGFQCRACVAEGRATQRTALTVSGSPIGQQPVATIGLIIANVLIFVVTVIQAGGTDHLERSSWFSGGVLVPSDVAEGEWWRLITSGFLHLSITHIALNMVALYFVGLPLERVVGRWRFLVIYFLSLLGGSVAVMLFADPGLGRGRRVRGDLRADGRAGGGVPAVPLRPAPGHVRRRDQSGDHLRDPRHLLAGARRRAGGRGPSPAR